ncbi:DUF2330 domain-containing protein [Micromonospora sp. CPCC 206060]|uniref:DUF2330 domain-containing protein n=1 Tax=Micromonospora sp. CPCC 206060 TaxID=3122406 RepID=UPI002FF3363A
MTVPAPGRPSTRLEITKEHDGPAGWRHPIAADRVRRVMATGRLATRIAMVVALAATMVAADPTRSGACACGAFVANDKLRAQQETALVELSGRTESITLSVQARSEATQAAFLMPVPARARFEVADGKLFTELDRISRPDVEVRRVTVDGDGAGAPAQADRGATVVDHVEIGPYEVAQLAGTDANAVSRWLGDNDFTLPAALEGALEPYLAEGWLIVAVRLAPTSGSISAGLPPMRLAFETDTPVYPMRLSATAENRQPLRLYVLADHRMDISNPAPQGSMPDLTFAGEVKPDPQYPTLSAALVGPRFLTRYDGEFTPAQITDDIRFTRSATDEPYRAVVIVREYVRSPWPMPAVPLILLGLALVAAAVLIVRSRRSARA